MTRLHICELDEIADPGAKEFILNGEECFAVRQGDEVYGYLNLCPHTARYLNWGPDKFLTRDGSQIMCAGHGAIFAISSGVCMLGPCRGRSLQPIDVRVEEGVVVAYDPEP
ncbi:MAG TPA: Rieske (2Fe-2S) protein [Gammaproteobacteria bacterium]|nr:Rieske (2Fe-2S) protein [Gammaproteobacteria bacterium]